jgi:hypothetical protein
LAYNFLQIHGVKIVNSSKVGAGGLSSYQVVGLSGCQI